MTRTVLLLAAINLVCTAEGQGLVVDVKLGYLSAETRNYATDVYVGQVPTNGGGTAAVAILGFFPDAGMSHGNGLRLSTALSGRSRLTWYGEAAVELLADEQGDIDFGRKEVLIGGGVQFTLTGRLALKGGVEFGYADLDFETQDRFGYYVETDGSGHTSAVKIGIEQGFDKHVIGLSLREALRREEISNPYNSVSYEDERFEVIIEAGFRL